MERVPIGVAVNRDGLNSESLCSPHDPARNLAPVCNQNLLYSLRRLREGSYRYQSENEWFAGELPAEDGGH